MAKTNWYSEIPYKERNNWCVTVCPFGMVKSDNSKQTVGSAGELWECPYLVEADAKGDKLVIKCNHPLNLE